VREFVDTELSPNVRCVPTSRERYCMRVTCTRLWSNGEAGDREWENAKRLPIEVFKRAYRAGILPGVVRGLSCLPSASLGGVACQLTRPLDLHA
jgi:hypothetical protein